MSRKKADSSDRFTKRQREHTNVSIAISFHDNKIEMYFKTPDYEGDIFAGVPWSRAQLEKYINPYVFDEMIERLLPVEITYMSFDARWGVEETERHLRGKNRRKAKQEKGQ